MRYPVLYLVLTFLSAMPMKGQTSGDTLVVSLKAIAGLQYDIVRFTVKPGAYLKVILRNEDEMEHNLVFTQPGKRREIVDLALAMGQTGPKLNYVPASPHILGFIPVLKPGEVDSILFRAPRKTGVYPYVCTFPGHGLIMYGAMYVTHGVMPPIADDPNVPPGRRKTEGEEMNGQQYATGSGHPYEPVPPYLYRVLMPDAGPAAIAVNLPNQLSYCWDAGACRLRYAWSGGFIDLTDYWMIKDELHAKILGTVFYRDKSAYPLRIGKPENIPSVDFKGYRLIEQYPEFHYFVDGIEVFELIRPKPDGSGLIRTFRLPAANRVIWFVHDPADGVSYVSSAGKWEHGRLRLNPDEARKFTLIMTKEEAGDL